MKYVVTESKINSTIYNFIDELFESEDGSRKIIKLHAIDSDGTPLDDAFDFVNSDYYGNPKSEALFNWTGEGYWKTVYGKGDITKIEYERWLKEMPTTELLDRNAINSLNSYFGELWKPIFKQWFKDKTGMDYKTLYLG